MCGQRASNRNAGPRRRMLACCLSCGRVLGRDRPYTRGRSAEALSPFVSSAPGHQGQLPFWKPQPTKRLEDASKLSNLIWASVEPVNT
jgi:hypothetical protein